tara:strand:+ start:275 stop:472 length:198 start_codon:yes stop_codon:yes gene_type:complete
MRKMSQESANAIFQLQNELDKVKALLKMFIDHFALTDDLRDVLVNRAKQIIGEDYDSEGTLEDIS